jgi:hypothetical protein
MSARPQDRPTPAELGASLTSLGMRLTAAGAGAVPSSTQEPPAPGAPPASARRLPAILGGTVGVLAAVAMAFTVWGQGSRDSETHQVPPSASTAAAGAGQAAARYSPTGLAVTRGRSGGELIVSWNMPIRPDVVATVIYQGKGTSRARAIFNYATSPATAPEVTMRGLPGGRQVCVSAAHVVSIDNRITNAVSRPVCAVPR